MVALIFICTLSNTNEFCSLNGKDAQIEHRDSGIALWLESLAQD